MKEGRELDAVIAEKVIGLPVKDYRPTMRRPFFSWCGEYTDISFAPNDEAYIVVDDKGKAGCPQVRRIPNFSTDIAYAWQVVEKLQTMFSLVSVAWDCHSGGWDVALSADSEVAENVTVGTAATAPLAICLAALEAVRT